MMLITLSFFTTIWNIIVFLMVLGLVICIHELGHLFFAKRAGILCHEFSFGMGPKLWSTKKGETTYSIRAIPFGGFVSMSGEEIEDELVKIGDKVRLDFAEDNVVKRIILNEKNPKYQDLLAVSVESIDLRTDNSLFINQYQVKNDAFYVFDKKEMQVTPNSRSFTGKTKWQRFLTIFGGPMMNFVLAFVLFLIIAFASGVPNTASTIVSESSENTPAYNVILPNDKIISINGVEVDTWSGEVNSISSELAKTVNGYDIVVERNGEQISLPTIYPVMNFVGLGFASSSENTELIIDRPLYLNTELLPGDKIISLNDLPMSTWEDIISFASANKDGSLDKEDLFKINVFRQIKTTISGEVDKITEQEGYYYIDIISTLDQSTATYKVNADETLLVEVGDTIVENAPLTEGDFYEFEYVVYGEDVLDAMNTDFYRTYIGIVGTNKFSFFGSIANSFVLTYDAAASIFGTLGLLFTSDLIGISDLSGFVGIFSLTSQAAAAGIISLLSFVGLLSVNLGIVNLLPIPALDGGKIVFIGYEAITRKKPNQKLENWLHTIVFFLLIALMIYVTYNDILKLIGI